MIDELKEINKRENLKGIILRISKNQTDLREALERHYTIVDIRNDDTDWSVCRINFN